MVNPRKRGYNRTLEKRTMKEWRYFIGHGVARQAGWIRPGAAVLDLPSKHEPGSSFTWFPFLQY